MWSNVVVLQNWVLDCLLKWPIVKFVFLKQEQFKAVFTWFFPWEKRLSLALASLTYHKYSNYMLVFFVQ